MRGWNHRDFQQRADNIATIEAIEEFIGSIPDFTPIRDACFRFWRSWKPGIEPSFQLGSYQNRPTTEIAEMRNVRRVNMGNCAFQRVMPINFMAEMASESELGQYLKMALPFDLRRTGFTISIRGPGAEAGLFIGDCDHDLNTWNEEFEQNKGALQIMGQSLHLAIVRLADAPKSILSAREHECLTRSAQGKTAKVIARELGLSDQTIAFYMSRIRMKLDVSNTTQAVAKATREGILS